jgi:DNA topoisomerase IA
MMNVAVSRAQNAFFVFGNNRRYLPAARSVKLQDASTSYSSQAAPTARLGQHLRKHAKPLYPKELVLIEASGKKDSLQILLGKNARVVASNGALWSLPIPNGVDVKHGLAPRPELNPGAVDILDRIRSILPDIESVTLMTDDDRMGEFIAWQLRTYLMPDICHLPTRRVRLGSITPAAVDARQYGTLDDRLVLAEAVREVSDWMVLHRLYDGMLSEWRTTSTRDIEDVAQSYGAMRPEIVRDGTLKPPILGRVQAAVLRLLLQRLNDVRGANPRKKVKVQAKVGGALLSGYVIDPNSKQVIDPDGEDDSRVKHVGKTLRILKCDVSRSTTPYRIDGAGTFDMLIAAWRRFQLEPAEVMSALQALYDGSWSNTHDLTTEPLEPIDPQYQGSGHPPILPLDRAAEPGTFVKEQVDELYRNVYSLVWMWYVASTTEGKQYEKVVLDCHLESDVTVRFEGASITGLPGEFYTGGKTGINDTDEALLLGQQSTGRLNRATEVLAVARAEACTIVDWARCQAKCGICRMTVCFSTAISSESENLRRFATVWGNYLSETCWQNRRNQDLYALPRTDFELQ